MNKFTNWRCRFNRFMKEWEQLINEILNRSKNPLQSVNFVFYFIVIVVGIGGIGLWLNHANSATTAMLYSSYATFSLTLAAACFADVILHKKSTEDNPDDDGIPSYLVFPYTCLFIVIAASSVLALVLCSFFPKQIDVGRLFAKISYYSCLFFWWQVNSKNPNLAKKEFFPEDSLGNEDEIDANITSKFKLT